MDRTESPRLVKTKVPSSRVSIRDFMTIMIDCHDCFVSMSWLIRKVLTRVSLNFETICCRWSVSSFSSSDSVSSSDFVASSVLLMSVFMGMVSSFFKLFKKFKIS